MILHDIAMSSNRVVLGRKVMFFQVFFLSGNDDLAKYSCSYWTDLGVWIFDWCHPSVIESLSSTEHDSCVWFNKQYPIRPRSSSTKTMMQVLQGQKKINNLEISVSIDRYTIFIVSQFTIANSLWFQLYQFPAMWRVSSLWRLRLTRHRCFSDAPKIEEDSGGISVRAAMAFPLILTAGVIFKDAFPEETPKKKLEKKEDEMEERLKQELQNTSFKEWKSAGFEPEKTKWVKPVGIPSKKSNLKQLQLQQLNVDSTYWVIGQKSAVKWLILI